MVNRKSYVLYHMVTFLMTFSDPKQPHFYRATLC